MSEGTAWPEPEISEPATTESQEAVVERPRKRQKIAVACDACRARKVKCDGIRPVCGVCARRKTNGLTSSCSYGNEKEGEPLISRRRSQASELQLAYPTPSASGQLLPPKSPHSGSFNVFEVSRGVGTPSQRDATNDRRIYSHGSLTSTPVASGIDSMTGVIGDQTHGFGFFGSSSAGSFMRQIKSAIDTKLTSDSRRPSISGTAKIPLFPQSPTTDANEIQRNSVEYILPPRRTADRLMSVYWAQVHLLYPFLDPEIFRRAYESVWIGSPLVLDERTLMCTLNTVFALSCQLSPFIKPEDREESARLYFKRAQQLLQLDLWDLGSAELIQCLLLMGQYLQSTSSPHQCWMIIGHAIRIAQGLGFHLPQTSTNHPSKYKKQFSRIIWHGCVLMDRVLSMTLGRPAMISKSHADAIPLPELNSMDEIPGGYQGSHQPSSMSFFVESLRLYDIMNDILLELYTNAENIPTKDRPGAAVIQSESEPIDLTAMLRLDQALMSWGRSLPPHLRISSIESLVNATFKAQSIVCRARFLHARILLFRPALSRFCLFENTPPTAGTALDEGLGYRMVAQCSSLCVRAAHDMIQLIYSNLSQDDLTGPLPAWWYSILYVYTAATVLLAARLQPIPNTDSTTYSIEESWEHAIQVLKSLERLGQSAQRCVAALEILSAKVPKFDHGGGKIITAPQDELGVPPDSSQPLQETTFGEYIGGIDVGGVEIDLSDMSWLNILPGDLY